MRGAAADTLDKGPPPANRPKLPATTIASSIAHPTRCSRQARAWKPAWRRMRSIASASAGRPSSSGADCVCTKLLRRCEQRLLALLHLLAERLQPRLVPRLARARKHLLFLLLGMVL